MILFLGLCNFSSFWCSNCSFCTSFTQCRIMTNSPRASVRTIRTFFRRPNWFLPVVTQPSPCLSVCLSACFLSCQGSFRGALSPGTQKASATSPRKRGQENAVVHFFRTIVSDPPDSLKLHRLTPHPLLFAPLLCLFCLNETLLVLCD